MISAEKPILQRAPILTEEQNRLLDRYSADFEKVIQTFTDQYCHFNVNYVRNKYGCTFTFEVETTEDIDEEVKRVVYFKDLLVRHSPFFATRVLRENMVMVFSIGLEEGTCQSL